MRNSFYEITIDAWLFRKTPATEGSHRSAEEEQVRQWCLHELLRAYGISISCLRVEYHIKVARERHPHSIDIVVLRENKPYIVIECKARSQKNHDAAMGQAVNYASLPDVNADFAVYTNGDVWWVRRRLRGQWVTVADIPNFRKGNCVADWRDILLAVDCISPVLYWLDQVVPGKQAPLYFAALQQFFYAQNEIIAGTDPKLLWTADHVLRVLADVTRHSNYTGGKMSHACDGLNKYWEERGVEPLFGRGDLWEMTHLAWADLSNLLDEARDMVLLDYQVMRVIQALLRYLNSMKGLRNRYQDVGSTVQSEIRDYMDLALTVRFNAQLPDIQDKTSLEDIRDFCRPAWEHYQKKR